MLEIVLVLIGMILIFLVKSIYFSIFVIFVLVGMVIPGLYSMVKGAPYLRTSAKRIKIMMRLGEFTDRDVVVDLGCGDGRVIREVARKGVKEAIGLEFSIPTFLLAEVMRVWGRGGEKILFRNFWKYDFSEVGVLICFLLAGSMGEFEKNIWPKLKKGTRVLVNEFSMKGIKSDKEEGRVFLYVKK